MLREVLPIVKQSVPRAVNQRNFENVGREGVTKYQKHVFHLDVGM